MEFFLALYEVLPHRLQTRGVDIAFTFYQQANLRRVHYPVELGLLW